MLNATMKLQGAIVSDPGALNLSGPPLSNRNPLICSMSFSGCGSTHVHQAPLPNLETREIKTYSVLYPHKNWLSLVEFSATGSSVAAQKRNQIHRGYIHQWLLAMLTKRSLRVQTVIP